MGQFEQRFRRLLKSADKPLSGDTVLVGPRARQKHLRGRTGVVTAIWVYGVKVDGKVHPLTPRSLTVIEEEAP